MARGGTRCCLHQHCDVLGANVVIHSTNNANQCLIYYVVSCNNGVQRSIRKIEDVERNRN
jgi:hypothetical protein